VLDLQSREGPGGPGKLSGISSCPGHSTCSPMRFYFSLLFTLSTRQICGMVLTCCLHRRLQRHFY
jgi:hypothetical protein